MFLQKNYFVSEQALLGLARLGRGLIEKNVKGQFENRASLCTISLHG